MFKKSPRKIGRFEKNMNNKKMEKFVSLQEALAKFIYLVRFSLDQLSCDSRKRWGTVKYVQALTVDSIHENYVKFVHVLIKKSKVT